MPPTRVITFWQTLSLTHHGKMYANNANTVRQPRNGPAWTPELSREFKLGTLTLIPLPSGLQHS